VKPDSYMTLDIPGEKTLMDHERSLTTGLAFSIVFALLMAVSANSYIYLPFTPVPITMQVLTVLLSGIMLGSGWALSSQIIYISLGLSGLPVFAGFKSGFLWMMAGPTGGYLAGFAVAAFITGYLYHSLKKDSRMFKNSLMPCFISCLAGIAVIYLSGYIHLFGYLYNMSRGTGAWTLALLTWRLGIQPFIIVEFIKLLIILNIFEIKKNKYLK
jgi:biotin transport system substrate-specific component